MNAGTLSEQLACFAADLRYEDLPAQVVERVRLHTLDILGVCLVGAPMEFARILRSVAGESGGASESTLIGSGGLKLPAPLATLYNGGLAHGNEFDDTYSAGRWHGSAAVAPPSLAAAELLHADGKAFVTAMAAGLETGCRLTRAAPALLGNGFHSTCTAGVFAAALSVGRLMGLGQEALTSALGICGSFASGTAEFLSDPEPWSKRIQVGHAGQSAIMAARAAAAGFKGPRSIFEGRHGYFRAYARDGNYDLSGITAALGKDWQLLYLYPKRYPCDHIAQGYVDCAVAIGLEAGVTPASIARVECIVHPLVVPVMFEPEEVRYRPTNGWSARWSMPFNMAVALTDHALTIDSWTDARANDAATRALMAKVGFTADPGMAFPGDYPARMRVHLADGRAIERDIPKVAGSAENPMPAEEYENKFLANARRAIDSAKAARIVAHMRELPELKDLAELAPLYA
ncbi:MAG: MmgE/PrpD family protein [Candidatus Parcubacteria bacterium]|nr:MmgE/PrpD family protein [Burkholderiales bacterium]